jgi:hypothetical protein
MIGHRPSRLSSDKLSPLRARDPNTMIKELSYLRGLTLGLWHILSTSNRTKNTCRMLNSRTINKPNEMFKVRAK